MEGALEGLRFKLGWVEVEDEKGGQRDSLEMDAEVESPEGEGGETDGGATVVVELSGLRSQKGGQWPGVYYYCYGERRG
jgi:hypothetical protein